MRNEQTFHYISDEIKIWKSSYFSFFVIVQLNVRWRELFVQITSHLIWWHVKLTISKNGWYSNRNRVLRRLESELIFMYPILSILSFLLHITEMQMFGCKICQYVIYGNCRKSFYYLYQRWNLIYETLYLFFMIFIYRHMRNYLIYSIWKF